MLGHYRMINAALLALVCFHKTGFYFKMVYYNTTLELNRNREVVTDLISLINTHRQHRQIPILSSIL